MFLICLAMLYVFFGVDTFASAPAPTPKCLVSGTIENVRFEAAYTNPCVRSNNCPTDTQTVFPDRYYLSVKLQNVVYKEGDISFTNCDSLYQVGQTQDLYVNKDNVNINDTFAVGQFISGTAVSFGSKSFETYAIDNLIFRKTGETCGLDMTSGKLLPNCEIGLECLAPSSWLHMGTGSVCVKKCTPLPACVNGVDDGSGNKVFCDPQPGVVYCPSVSPLPTWVLGIKGDANGDGKVDLVDFVRWKYEYVEMTAGEVKQLGYSSDFNNDGKVDLIDFSIWKSAYLLL